MEQNNRKDIADKSSWDRCASEQVTHTLEKFIKKSLLHKVGCAIHNMNSADNLTSYKWTILFLLVSLLLIQSAKVSDKQILW